MNEQEIALLSEEVGSVSPELSVKARRGIDAGRWWRRTPVWVNIYDDELVVLAVSRRRYIERVPLSECGDSTYCAATGELIIAPYEGLEVSRFAMSPRDALAVLSYLKND